MAPIITRTNSESSVDASKYIPLGEYLFLRVAQASPHMKTIFGIPGDFNLPLLEHMYTDSVSSKLEFVGICNELNAAYAADGYAKAMNGMSVLITTFGVGELSAINGIAGAFAEYAPVMHIVGTTSTKQREQATNATPEDIVNIHHLVQNKDSLKAPIHDIYKSTAETFSVVLESLDTDIVANLDKIDRVITRINQESRPGYLYVPQDISDIQVPADRLFEALDFSELNNATLLQSVSSRILENLYKAKNPSVMGDILVERFHIRESFDAFTKALPSNHVKLFNSIEGRVVDETLPNFLGNFGGALSCGDRTRQRVEQESDLLIIFGYAESENNTGGGSRDFSNIENTIFIHPDYIKFNKQYVELKDAEGQRQFSIGDLMAQLLREYSQDQFENIFSTDNIGARQEPVALTSFDGDHIPPQMITQNKIIDFFNDVYLKPNDIFVVETSSFLFGVPDLKFPPGVRYISQSFYGSIGYALPATFGICRAQRDRGLENRVVLIQGDGSAQMTVQELSSFIRHDIKAPEIFLMNNDGYTIERYIEGPTRSYNDIQGCWKWGQLFEVFGDHTLEKHESLHINNMDDLNQLASAKPTGKIRFMDLKLEKMDGSRRLNQMMPQK